MGEPVWIDAPAKINLALHVTGQRPDGYHLIETLAVFADIHDRIAVALAEKDGFVVEGSEASALAGEDPSSNLVIRARDFLRDIADKAGMAAPSVNVRLEKNLPTGSGIGGGSADAAATLRALSALWRLDHLEQTIRDHAVRLGADVPMCLASMPLVARGIGEDLEPLSGMPALDILLVNPRRHISTPAVFKALDRKDNAPLPQANIASGPHGLADWLARETRNDLEAPSVRLTPAIGDCLVALDATDPLLARMSGSGATCFAIYPDGDTARDAASRLLRDHPDWWIKTGRTGPSGREGA
ncbi:4-(cytidine 5'-diphospho)-2-C-methyl-D-erythritol kinase [Oricola indica]|uniref:4-(cytidine 5'-diphospho)-2-C-methyl-D-erythritol kinase n=1 Tax=Oricola indica TaxID=2872591 RepID=UPI003CCBDACA